MNHHSLQIFLFVFPGTHPGPHLHAQGVICIPSRLYFTTPPNSQDIQEITVINTGHIPLKLGISVGNWDYDFWGNERTFDAGTLKTSAAGWIRTHPASCLIVEPGNRHRLEILLKTPAASNSDNSVLVRTAMIFLTRLNPAEPGMGAEDGYAGIRPGVKVHHSFYAGDDCDCKIMDFRKLLPDSPEKPAILELTLSMAGKFWDEGIIQIELRNMDSGKKTKLPNVRYYALPGDMRVVNLKIPPGTAKGRYLATALIGSERNHHLKMAEIEFAMP